MQLGARDFHAQSRHGLRIIVMIYSAFCFRMSGFARILLGMGGGTVHSSFECVASGPSGCRCERSSWCAAIRQSVQNQLTWNTFKNIVYCTSGAKLYSKNKETNETQPSPDTFFLQVFYICTYYWHHKGHKDSCSATMPSLLPSTCLAAQLRGGRWPQLCPVLVCWAHVAHLGSWAPPRLRLGAWEAIRTWKLTKRQV